MLSKEFSSVMIIASSVGLTWNAHVNQSVAYYYFTNVCNPFGGIIDRFLVKLREGYRNLCEQTFLLT